MLSIMYSLEVDKDPLLAKKKGHSVRNGRIRPPGLLSYLPLDISYHRLTSVGRLFRRFQCMNVFLSAWLEWRDSCHCGHVKDIPSRRREARRDEGLVDVII